MLQFVRNLSDAEHQNGELVSANMQISIYPQSGKTK